ncbi:MAG: hypothetical protein KDK75_24000, partial [Alphaproteobacteria bacterium]|nr:hypothetical protein [Alphaproteobacteria bacterium]
MTAVFATDAATIGEPPTKRSLTNGDAVQALVPGRADVHMSGNTVAAYAVSKAGDKVKLTTLKVD